ncbi:DUF4300 family protein [Clostridium sp. D33t1_170424_F3]|uniref:DUF4300 family protein n=1 Tax=Clostridium sp. D33t1_170424_F3 TaxID=2787099 RepID=UPI0018A8944A|nr:DUF4300 family protein [Clostridium sp. D33t1_170424_F3]
MKKTVILLSTLLMALALISCQDAGTSGTPPLPDASSSSSANTALMSYSNLKDDASKVEVRQFLESAGINTGYVDSLFAAVDDYNTLDASLSQNIGFVEASLQDPEYSGIEWPGDRDYYDANCRVTAFALMRDLITAVQPQTADSFAAYDQEIIGQNPWYQLNDAEQGNFFALIDAVAVEPTTDFNVVREGFLKEWQTRGITFSSGPVSLISVIVHSELDNIAFIGHCGVLVDNGTQLLFLEKYGPAQPYQATLLKDRGELKTYLMSRFQNFYTEGVSAKPFLLENDSVFPGQVG